MKASRSAKKSILSRVEQKQRTRAKLLRAARAVLAARGLAKTTTREIADRAGVASGTLFVHFPGVPSLVEALLDDHIKRALRRAYASLPARGSVVTRLVHVARHMFNSYDVEPELSKAYLTNSLFNADPLGPAGLRLNEFQKWVSGEIQRAVERKEMAALSPEVAFIAFFSIYLNLLGGGLRGEFKRAQQVELLTKTMERILKPGRGR